jgi:hypothetical protein
MPSPRGACGNSPPISTPCWGCSESEGRRSCCSGCSIWCTRCAGDRRPGRSGGSSCCWARAAPRSPGR